MFLERHIDFDTVQKSCETVMDSGASCTIALCLLIVVCILAVNIVRYKIYPNIRDGHLNDLDKIILNLLLVIGLYTLLSSISGTANNYRTIYIGRNCWPA